MEIKFIGILKIDTSEYWNWVKSLFPPALSNEEVFDKWMPEARAYTYRFLKLQGYNNNPIDKWCFSNTEIKTDINGNIQPVKGLDNRKRIDGCVSKIIGYVVLKDKESEYQNMI